MLPAQPNQSLIDGLSCLLALAAHRAPVGSRALGRQCGLESTRVNRLLKTLAHLGIAQQTADKKYVAGPGMHVLSAMSLFGSGLVQRALIPLEQLHSTGHTVALGVLWRDQVSYLYHGAPRMNAAQALGRMGLFPATRSSIGLALLAKKTEADVRSLFADQDIPGFPAGADALLAELESTRQRGYARVNHENPEQTSSIAITVGTESSAAIALSGRLENEIPELLAEMNRTVEQILSTEK